MNVSVIGLGKLGAPLAASLAAGGLTVHGVEKSQARLDQLADPQADLCEPQLAELLAQHSGQLQLGSDTARAVSASEASFLIVPTPSHSEGHFDLALVLQACAEVGGALRQKKVWHLVVLVSTVMPTDCTKSIIPALESASGKRCGTDFGFCYNPAFIALGSVVRDLRNPDVVLIGESDERAGQTLTKIQIALCQNNPPIKRTNTVNAEIAKLSLNTYVTMKISFGNSLGRLCMNTPEADANKVWEILGSDSRIGHKYLKPGLAYGGPCFPRDTKAFESFARSRDMDAWLATATERVNQDHHKFLLDWTLQNHRGGPIALLGLAYKPGTPVHEKSPGLALAEALLQQGKEIRCYDPEARYDFGKARAGWYESAVECVQGAEVVVLATNWPELAHLPPECLGGKTVLDCWKQLDPAKLPASCCHQVLGESLCHVSQLS